MARSATIIGLQALDRKLKRLPQVAKDMIRDAMAKSADEIVEMMKSLVPVSADGSHGREAGTLRDSIGWTWGQAPRGSKIVSTLKGRGVGGELSLTIYAGSSEAFYVWFQEFGTQKMPASPFFYVSWRANRTRAKRRVNRAVRESAKKVAAGG